jgi:rhodanese-related sulfurtransferase
MLDPSQMIHGALARLMLISLLLGASGAQAQAGLSAADLAQQMASQNAPLILDVRSVDEFNAGHITGATHIPHDQLAARLAELPDQDTPIVVYCHSGRRAAAAEAVLAEAGFTQVMDLDGHWRAWNGPREPPP